MTILNVVGARPNFMKIAALVQFREKAARTTILADLGLQASSYVLMTMHRPATVGRQEGLEKLMETIEYLSALQPVVFPIHPRTRNRFREFGLAPRLEAQANLMLLEPLGYLEFLRLMENAVVVVTDLGGIQEETTFLKVPCLTLRENTERPVTIDLGTNTLMELDPEGIRRKVEALLNAETAQGQTPPLWDGKAAHQIADILEQCMNPAADDTSRAHSAV